MEKSGRVLRRFHPMSLQKQLGLQIDRFREDIVLSYSVLLVRVGKEIEGEGRENQSTEIHGKVRGLMKREEGLQLNFLKVSERNLGSCDLLLQANLHSMLVVIPDGVEETPCTLLPPSSLKKLKKLLELASWRGTRVWLAGVKQEASPSLIPSLEPIFEEFGDWSFLLLPSLSVIWSVFEEASSASQEVEPLREALSSSSALSQITFLQFQSLLQKADGFISRNLRGKGKANLLGSVNLASKRGKTVLMSVVECAKEEELGFLFQNGVDWRTMDHRVPSSWTPAEYLFNSRSIESAAKNSFWKKLVYLCAHQEMDFLAPSYDLATKAELLDQSQQSLDYLGSAIVYSKGRKEKGGVDVELEKEEGGKREPQTPGVNRRKEVDGGNEEGEEARHDAALMDSSDNLVMCLWEENLMTEHVKFILDASEGTNRGPVEEAQRKEEGEAESSASQCRFHGCMSAKKLRVLNVGFGLGLVDSILNQCPCIKQHTVIEAHPQVKQRIEKITANWKNKDVFEVVFGRWQEVFHTLKGQYDAIFFDTYAEDYRDLYVFHRLALPSLLAPGGRYSFYNGMASHSLLGHSVYAKIAEMHLKKVGFSCDFKKINVEKDGFYDDSRVEAGASSIRYWQFKSYWVPRVEWNTQDGGTQK